MEGVVHPEPPMISTLPDLLGPGLAAVFCGINPGLRAAASGHHFAGRGNRFWPALHLAGFTPSMLDPSDDARLLAYGYGITAVVPRATRSASDIGASDLRAGLRDLGAKIRRFRPHAVAFLGKPAWALFSGSTSMPWGRQPETFGGIEAWVLPNPSGLNRGFSLTDLVTAYSKFRIAIESGMTDRAR
jgi:TDG/mug DNA glycosylase family protein